MVSILTVFLQLLLNFVSELYTFALFLSFRSVRLHPRPVPVRQWQFCMVTYRSIFVEDKLPPLQFDELALEL